MFERPFREEGDITKVGKGTECLGALSRRFADDGDALMARITVMFDF